MPKILIDNSKKIKPERTYAIKTCPVCGSSIEIFESDIINAHIDENDYIQFECPCGKKLSIKKYFMGKIYNENDYLKCADYFHEKVRNMLWDDLRYIPFGYGREYFTLNHTEIIINPISVLLKVYIDRYKHGNWEKCIRKNELYKEYKFNLCMLSSDMNNCSRYAQALMDYIISNIKKVCYQKKGDTDLNLKFIDDKDLIAFIRNADMNINEREIHLAIDEKMNFLLEEENRQKCLAQLRAM